MQRIKQTSRVSSRKKITTTGISKRTIRNSSHKSSLSNLAPSLRSVPTRCYSTAGNHFSRGISFTSGRSFQQPQQINSTISTPRQWLSALKPSDIKTIEDQYNHTVSLFTKEECSLCVPVKAAIMSAKEKYDSFRYVEVDITLPEHKDYFKMYKWDIPVVHIDGKEYCRHFIDEVDFDATIRELK